MWTWLKKLGRWLFARREAAMTTRLNRQHWQNADNLSPARSASLPIRRILRSRARLERENSPYLDYAIQTRSTHVIGANGPQLEVISEDEALATTISELFTDWADTVDLSGKLRTMDEARNTTGEGCCVLINNPNSPHAIKLDLKGIETDLVTSNEVNLLEEDLADGIVFDEFGNIVSFNVLKVHPNDSTLAFGIPSETIEAQFMMFWPYLTRAGALRGIPRIAPSLELGSRTRRLVDAVTLSAEIAASYSIVLTTQNPVEATPLAPMSQSPIAHGMQTAMPEGWNVNQMQPNQPSTPFESFAAFIIGVSAMPLCIPKSMALADSSKSNFASRRFDHLLLVESLKVDRDSLEVLLDRMFLLWLEEALLLEDFLPKDIDLASITWRWHWRNISHVFDAQKEAAADDINLKNRTVTLASIYANRGENYRHSLNQIAKETKLMDSLGITPVVPGPAAPTVAPSDPQNSDVQEDE